MQFCDLQFMIMNAGGSWDYRCPFEKCIQQMTCSFLCLQNSAFPLQILSQLLWWQREQDHLACCRNFHRLWVGMCLQIAFLSDLFWTLFGAIWSAYTSELSTERACAQAPVLPILLNFQCASWSSLDRCLTACMCVGRKQRRALPKRQWELYLSLLTLCKEKSLAL